MVLDQHPEEAFLTLYEHSENLIFSQLLLLSEIRRQR